MAVENRTLPLARIRNSPWIARAFGLALGFVGWTLMAMVFPNNLMPYPFETLVLAYELVNSGVAWPHLAATLWRTLWGFLGAMFLGILIGVAMGINDYSEGLFSPYVTIGLSIPAIAWAAITTLIYGFTIMAPVGATILTTFPYIAINVWKGVEAIDVDLIYMSDSFNVSRPRMLARLIVPSAAPALFSAFRFGLAVSWKIVTIAEVFSSNSGIGYKLMEAYELFRFEQAWAWSVLFIIVILLIEYGVVKPLERRVFEYRHDADFELLG